jgi:hypothetical protein
LRICARKSKHEKIRGDLRILELLTKKDEQAQKNIGDPSAFLGVFDVHQEEIKTGEVIEASLTPEQFETQMEQTAGETDWLAILQGNIPPPKGETAESHARQMQSIYASDLDYFAAGLKKDGRLDFTVDADRKMISLTVPRDLTRALRRALPHAALPDSGRLNLTADRKRVQEEIVKARAGEQLWPEVHLLWDLHPAVEWLNHRLLVSFGRAQAPVGTLRGALGPQEIVFLMQGEIPNRKGQAVVHSWFGVLFDCGVFKGIEELPSFLARTGFDRKLFPNSATSRILIQLARCWPRPSRMRAAGCPSGVPRSTHSWRQSLPRCGRNWNGSAWRSITSFPSTSMRTNWSASGCAKNK